MSAAVNKQMLLNIYPRLMYEVSGVKYINVTKLESAVESKVSVLVLAGEAGCQRRPSGGVLSA